MPAAWTKTANSIRLRRSKKDVVIRAFRSLVELLPVLSKEYLAVAEGWTKHFGGEISDRWQTEALQFALQRGSRSGRVAYQFARDWAGRMHLETEHDN